MRLSERGSWMSLCVFGYAGIVCGQAVVSTHAGVVNYSEGTLLLDDQILNQKPGTFPAIKQGSVLRTEAGRAEILLGTGVFLRVDENSAIRMLSTELTNTRVEFLRGSAILDANSAAAGPSLILTYKNFEVRFPKPGVYRVDSDPGVFETYTGQAEIRAANLTPKLIDESNQFFFGIGLETKKYGEGAIDNFSEWCRNRAETLNADQEAANQGDANPDDPGQLPFGGSVPGPAVPTMPSPSYGFPGLGSAAIAPTVIDNPFGFGPYAPIYNQPFYANPLVIFWVFPRDRTNPIRHGVPPPSRIGYPVRPRLQAGYPVLAPGRRSYTPTNAWAPGASPASRSYAPVYASPSPVRTYGVPVHTAAPAFRPAPAVRPAPMPAASRATVHR